MLFMYAACLWKFDAWLTGGFFCKIFLFFTQAAGDDGVRWSWHDVQQICDSATGRQPRHVLHRLVILPKNMHFVALRCDVSMCWAWQSTFPFWESSATLFAKAGTQIRQTKRSCFWLHFTGKRSFLGMPTHRRSKIVLCLILKDLFRKGGVHVFILKPVSQHIQAFWHVGLSELGHQCCKRSYFACFGVWSFKKAPEQILCVHYAWTSIISSRNRRAAFSGGRRGHPFAIGWGDWPWFDCGGHWLFPPGPSFGMSSQMIQEGPQILQTCMFWATPRKKDPLSVTKNVLPFCASRKIQPGNQLCRIFLGLTTAHRIWWR